MPYLLICAGGSCNDGIRFFLAAFGLALNLGDRGSVNMGSNLMHSMFKIAFPCLWRRLIVQEAVNLCECAGLFALIDIVHILPPVSEDGNDHGEFRYDFIKDSCSGADHNVVYNPQRGIDEHSSNPDFLTVICIAADGRGDIGHHGQDGNPPRPGEHKSEQLHRAENATHGLAACKSPLAAQAEGTNCVDNIADTTGDCTQQK